MSFGVGLITHCMDQLQLEVLSRMEYQSKGLLLKFS
ncbi:unnamed protein product [Musa acuminata subsp. malaccensis]|uniref:(wild Malaysian banana) hypothetical protein n=1 Tax=Musa acuminata subsp. malaccensis TaxID=214687 RepID=A0A8D7AA97_MUSAM|nr:unnamed protein product [Musa acuminata subsp. malaccensis]